MAKSMKLGGGGRFEKLKGKLAGKPGVKDPAALAASIGRKKLGADKMADLATKGKAREEKSEKTGGLSDGLKAMQKLKKK